MNLSENAAPTPALPASGRAPSEGRDATIADARRWTFAGWRKRFFGMLRLTAYVFCASLLCAALAARVVIADLKEGTIQLGRELEPVGDALGTTKTIFLNGTQMNVSNAVTEASPKDVLDRFQSLCGAHPALLARAFADLPQTLQEKVAPPQGGVHLGVMRAEASGDGALSCFMDDRPAPAADVPARLKAFAASWDLSEFGRFRYVYASALKSGKTQVRTVWADGAFNLKQMFPARGDAAGFDSPVLPRPAGSRRLFSATSAQVHFGVHIYDSPEDKPALLRFYDREMTARGWRLAVDSSAEHDAVAYTGDPGHTVYISFARKGTRTLVTTTETARPSDSGEATIELHN